MVESRAANFSGDADAKAPSPQPSPRGRGSGPWRRARFRNSYPCSSPRPLLCEPPESSPSPSGGDGVARQSRELPLPRAGEGGGEGCRRRLGVYLHGMVESRAANFSGDADAKAPSPQPSPRGRGSSPWRYLHGMVDSHAANFSGDADAKAPSPQPSPRGRGGRPWRRARFRQLVPSSTPCTHPLNLADHAGRRPSIAGTGQYKHEDEPGASHHPARSASARCRA